MLILGSVVDEEKDPSRGQAVHKAVEKCLGLGGDPVKVFEEEDQRLHLTFPDQQPPQRLERALPPSGWVEGLPLAVPYFHVQEGEQGRQEWLEAAVERQELAGDLLVDRPLVVAIGDAEIPLEEVDDGQVARRPPVGYRRTF